MRRLVDFRLRRLLRRSDLPDLPEVRALMGFAFGAVKVRPEVREQAVRAVARHAAVCDCWPPCADHPGRWCTATTETTVADLKDPRGDTASSTQVWHGEAADAYAAGVAAERKRIAIHLRERGNELMGTDGREQLGCGGDAEELWKQAALLDGDER